MHKEVVAGKTNIKLLSPFILFYFIFHMINYQVFVIIFVEITHFRSVLKPAELKDKDRLGLKRWAEL